MPTPHRRLISPVRLAVDAARSRLGAALLVSTLLAGCGSPSRNETIVLRNAGTLPALINDLPPSEFEATPSVLAASQSREHWEPVGVLVTHHDAITGLPLWRSWAVVGDLERRELGEYPSLLSAVSSEDPLEPIPQEHLEIPIEVLHQALNVALIPFRLIAADHRGALRQYGPFGPYEYVPDGPADLKVLPPLPVLTGDGAAPSDAPPPAAEAVTGDPAAAEGPAPAEGPALPTPSIRHPIIFLGPSASTPPADVPR